MAASGSVGKVLRVLDCMALSGRPMGVSEIGRRTGLPKSTVHRLLVVLGDHGRVRREGSAYQLVRARGTAAEGNGARELRRILMPQLLGLHGQTGLAVSLAVLRDVSVEFVETLFTQSLARLVLPTSTVVPAHCTSAGKLLLAYHAEPAALVSRSDLVRFTPQTITDQGALLEELARIRRQGLAVSRGEYVAGSAGMAAPVRLRPGLVVASIVVSGPSGAVDLPAIERRLRLTALAATTVLRTSG